MPPDYHTRMTLPTTGPMEIKEMSRMEQSRPIVPPPGFPVTWENPEDERLFWTHDRMHWPDPLPVISFDLMIEDGVNPAAIEYDAPIRFDGRRINCYQYTAFHPPMLPPEELHAMGERAQKNIGDTLARFGERWEGEWLPEIKQYIEWWDSFDLPGAPIAALNAQ